MTPKETKAADTTTEPLLAPPGEHQSDQKSEQRGEDNGGGGGGGGVSWIAELASSVGVLPAGEKPPTAEAEKQPDEANGLGWIEEVVSHVEAGPGSPNGTSSSSLPGGAPNPTQSTATMAGIVLPSPNPGGDGFSPVGPTTSTPAAAGLVPATRVGTASRPPATTPISATMPVAGGGGGGGGSGQTTPGRTKAAPPLAQTRTHLTWKPITDGTATRPWGAPPPDEDQDETTKEKPGKRQEMASPPRLSRNQHSSETSSAVADHTSISQPPPGRQDPMAGPGGGGSGTNTDDKQTKTMTPPSSEGSKRQESDSGKRIRPGDGDPPKVAAAAGVGEAGLKTRERTNDRAPHSSGNNISEMAVARDPQDPQGKKPGRSDTESIAEGRKQCPGEPPKTLPPLQERVSASGPGDSAGRSGTRWDTLRSSVQRR